MLYKFNIRKDKMFGADQKDFWNLREIGLKSNKMGQLFLKRTGYW